MKRRYAYPAPDHDKSGPLVTIDGKHPVGTIKPNLGSRCQDGYDSSRPVAEGFDGECNLAIPSVLGRRRDGDGVLVKVEWCLASVQPGKLSGGKGKTIVIDGSQY